MESPFHEGELKIQQLVGEDDIAERNGQMIKGEILAGAVNFIAMQQMVILGSVSREGGSHWASVLSGKEGFVSAPERTTLVFDLNLVDRVESDPVWQNLESGKRLAVLLIDLETRRRLKVNGLVEGYSENQLRIRVEESYPLCPKYIQRRSFDLTTEPSTSHFDYSTGTILGDAAREIISQSDTAFLVTSHVNRGLDVSHRGGKPGFLKVVSENQIRCPDYAGNSMFNSFGNLELNSKAGLIVLDFKNARLLQLTGTAFIELNQDDNKNETGGTGRFWTFEIEKSLLQPMRLSQREFLDYSPFLP